MRKILFFGLISVVVWFFCFASPATRDGILRSLQTSASESRHLASLAGQPVAPSIVQKLYSPHADLGITKND